MVLTLGCGRVPADTGSWSLCVSRWFGALAPNNWFPWWVTRREMGPALTEGGHRQPPSPASFSLFLHLPFQMNQIYGDDQGTLWGGLQVSWATSVCLLGRRTQGTAGMGPLACWGAASVVTGATRDAVPSLLCVFPLLHAWTCSVLYRCSSSS